MESKIANWNKLASLPDAVSLKGDMTMINDHEFVFAPNRSLHSLGIWGIYKYNKYSNEWNKFIKYPENFESHDHNIEYNKHDNKLYIYGANANMTIINTKTHQFEVNSDCIIKYCGYPHLVNENGTIHLIGGWGNPKHFIWDSINKSFIEIHHFTEFEGISSASALLVPSKNIILLIGGSGTESYQNTKPIDIMYYTLNDRKWHKIQNISLSHSNVCATLTFDEKHVIITCGDIDNDDVDEIYVLKIIQDKEDYKFQLKKSKIRSPDIGAHIIVKTGSLKNKVLLINGYIRKLFKSSKSMPPYDIINLIIESYSNQIIHWIKWDDNEHFAIDVGHILSSVE